MKKNLILFSILLIVIFASISCGSSKESSADSNKKSTTKETELKVPPSIAKAKVKADSKIQFSGKFNPRAATVGERVVIELQITNLSKTPVNNLGISFTNNFFKGWQISRTAPKAKIKKNGEETIFIWGKLNPSETLTSNIVIFPSELGQFKSLVYLKDGEELLKDETGKTLSVNAHIDIYR